MNGNILSLLSILPIEGCYLLSYKILLVFLCFRKADERPAKPEASVTATDLSLESPKDLADMDGECCLLCSRGGSLSKFYLQWSKEHNTNTHTHNRSLSKDPGKQNT